jgi:hypothetical protein
MFPARFFLTLLLVAQLPGHPSLTTRRVSGERLTVGDPFDVALVLAGADSSQVMGPLADSLGVFLPVPQEDRAAGRRERDRNVHRLRLAAFKAGRHGLPVFTFLVRTGTRVDTLRSEPESLTVASVLRPDMKDINDLKPAETFPNRWLWIVPLALLLAAALVLGGVRLYRRIRRIRAQAANPPPAWEQALAALDALPWREWLAAGQVKRYYYALSQVLKRYIERRFEFNALEQTTTEILSSIRVRKMPMRDEVRQFLVRSDFVKYARTIPPDEEMRSAIDQVRDFVVRTKPAEPAPAAPASAGGSTPEAGEGRV